jgi:hypothetical protein
MADKIITQEYLQSIFEYKDGQLFWKIKPSCRIHKNTIAGTWNNGYCFVSINKKKYLVHRFIFMMHNGYLPNFIDHIDGNPSNNLINNLRPATKSENACNRKLSIINKSGIKNVNWKKNKWCVQIQINKQKIHIGYYKDIELAELAAIEARNKYHGQFARYGV